MKFIKNKKMFKLGLFLFIMMYVSAFFSAKYDSATIVIIGMIGGIVGFLMIAFSLIDLSEGNLYIFGKLINTEDIANFKKLTLKQKFDAFNGRGFIEYLIFWPAVLGVTILIGSDPMGFFANFENVGQTQVLAMFGFLFISILVWTFYKKVDKNIKIFIVISFVYLLLRLLRAFSS